MTIQIWGVPTPPARKKNAHQLARLFCHLCSTGEPYQDPGADYYEHKHKQRMINNLKKKTQQLGSQLALNLTP